MSSALKNMGLYADRAGESHFEPAVAETFTRNFAPASAFNVSRFVPALRSVFLLAPAGWIGDHITEVRWVWPSGGNKSGL
jgi:hypothetical protein